MIQFIIPERINGNLLLCFNLGALISAGFEVSATVVHENQTDIGLDKNTGAIPNSSKRQINMDATSSGASINNKNNTDHLLDTMVDWLTKVPENQL